MSSPAVHQPYQHLAIDATWEVYLYLSGLFDNRSSWRVTYDRGVVEVRQLTFRHASVNHLLGRLVDVLTEELDCPVASGGSTTLRLREKRAALEPDNCYWIRNELFMRQKVNFDLRTDPPPDLALEIVPRAGLLNRLPVLRRLRVGEVWRLRRRTVRFMVLQPEGKYVRSETSGLFRGLAACHLPPFLALWGKTSETGIIGQFRAWVREQIAAGVLKAAAP